MSELRVIYGVVGLLFIGLGIPLLLRKVRPNRWYGFRTAKTLSHPDIWYPANALCGRNLIFSGLAVLAADLVTGFTGPNNVDALAILLLAVLAVSLGWTVIHGFLALRKMV